MTVSTEQLFIFLGRRFAALEKRRLKGAGQVAAAFVDADGMRLRRHVTAIIAPATAASLVRGNASTNRVPSAASYWPGVRRRERLGKVKV
jgi:hypothetical protein